jgi:hypothetical protein
MPLRRILVLADDRMAEIQLLHRADKPKCSRISMRNGHDTKSKALAISTLSTGKAFFVHGATWLHKLKVVMYLMTNDECTLATANQLR